MGWSDRDSENLEAIRQQLSPKEDTDFDGDPDPEGCGCFGVSLFALAAFAFNYMQVAGHDPNSGALTFLRLGIFAIVALDIYLIVKFIRSLGQRNH
jgi:hypothetical protein